MTRDELLRPLFPGGVDSSCVPDDWELIPAFIDGKHAASVMIKGTEVHFGFVPEFRHTAALRRSVSNDLFRPLLARWGFLTTRVELGSRGKQRFVERVGFAPTWVDEQFQYYLLGDLPLARRKR